MLLKDGNAFELGSLFGPSDPQRPYGLLSVQEQEVGTCRVLAVKIHIFMDSLAFDEDTSANSLALEDKLLALSVCPFALLDIDELCFHGEHSNAKQALGQERENVRTSLARERLGIGMDDTLQG